MANVRLVNINKVFDTQQVLDDVEIEIADGEFMVFVGPSGCGKTTLMRTIAGLERPTSGRVFIDDDDVTHAHPARRGVAMVFQSYALYPHMSVYDNIAFGLKHAKVPREKIKQQVQGAAAILQIESLLDRKPAALSGGQRQRVAIGRAIVRDPGVFLFDEPLSNLDAALRVQMRLELIKLHDRLGSTMVYVTHDQVEAMTMANRIVVLNNGHVEQVGTPLELYRQPRNRFVAGFIGSPKMNFLTVPVTRADEEGVTVKLPGEVQLTIPVEHQGISPENTLTLGVRPEHLGLRKEENGTATSFLPTEVTVVEHLGGEILVHTRLADGEEIEIKAPGHYDVTQGECLEVTIDHALCHLFDDSEQALPALGSRMTAA